MATLERLVVDVHGDAVNANSGCEMVMLEMLVLYVNSNAGNAGTGCKRQQWKCCYWMPMPTLEMLLHSTTMEVLVVTATSAGSQLTTAFSPLLTGCNTNVYNMLLPPVTGSVSDRYSVTLKKINKAACILYDHYVDCSTQSAH